MKKINSKILYEKYGDKMCLAPFFNSFYVTNNVLQPGESPYNVLRPCSLVKGDWSIQASTIKEDRNNATWKNIRQNMLEGKLNRIENCRVCITAEEQGASSPRQLNNDYLMEHLDIDIIGEIEKVIANGMVSDSIYVLDWMPSNYCNYSCIMCSGGASSSRLTFEIKQGKKLKYAINPVQPDFYDLLKDVKILGFTGGETILQPQAHALIDYVIEKDLAKNIIMPILTNASDFPDSLHDKFKHFKKVLYTVSVDGLGDVIEYQRRGSNWATLEKNVIKIHQSIVHEFLNYVVTSINILSAMDFIDWCHDNDLKFIAISPVFQQNILGIPAMPPELKSLALQRLKDGRKRYEHYLSSQYKNYERNWVTSIDRLIGTIENVEFNPAALEKFIEHIKIEDTASKKPLREVVPEWAPWFD
jgi:sulfatase maturation enzyme AslB (radical SAM superfamily)